MLKIHTKDGHTHRVDLKDENQAKHWLPLLKRHDFQDAITGVSVVQECRSRIRCPSCGKPNHLFCTSCDKEIPAASYASTGVQYSLSKPDGYGKISYAIEDIENNPESKVRGGERVVVFAGDSRVSMMVHSGQPSVRITLLKVGRQSYNAFTG